uniref:hypothetical protein n=1 Tax=uncultured Draconibacterium sp. TaxID=1573823 RepID=UPI003216CFF0
MKRSSLILVILLLCIISSAQQLQLEVNGSANFENSVFEIREAGLDFSSALEVQSSIFLTLHQGGGFTKKNNPNKKWRIAIFKQDDWNDDLKLEVKRTGKGNNIGNNGKPNVHGGENYQVVRNTETWFFEGKGEIRDIPLRIKLSGVSLKMGAGSHNSRIVFTVYDGW